MRSLIPLFLLLSCFRLSSQNTLITISVSEANQPSTPMRVQLLKPLAADKIYFLRNLKTKKNIAAQLLDSVTVIFMTEERMPAGDHIYSVITDTRVNIPPPVTIEKQENGLLVKVKNKRVFFYHTKEAMPSPDSPSYYRRSGFIHPLYSPSGKILTDDFPVGHAHQHAIFTAWTNTTFRKTSVDFWNQQSKKGTVEHSHPVNIIQGPVFSQIKTYLSHKSHEFGEVLREQWTITIYPLDEYFLFDLESEQQNTTNDTLFLNKYHYGGMAFRGSRQWNEEDHKNFKNRWNVLTSEGLKDSAANASHARWVNVSGGVDGELAGTTVFNHPSNFRYPQAIRIHPSMPYWAYSPVVDGPFYIAPGSSYRAKFRYYVHDAQPPAKTIERLFKQWGSPDEARGTIR